jgi:CRP-like cAMP-binding protein
MKDPLAAMRPLERHELARLLASCPRTELAAGETCCAGDFAGAALLVIERGLAAQATRTGSRRRMILAFCRERAVLPPPGRAEELVAVSECTIVAVTTDAYCRLLQLPTAALAIVQALVAELRERDESLAQFANVSHAERLRGKLQQLARSHGAAVDGGIRIELPLTHELLGQAIGSARETVTAALRTLEAEGFVVREGRRYLLPAAQVLAA